MLLLSREFENEFRTLAHDTGGLLETVHEVVVEGAPSLIRKELI